MLLTRRIPLWPHLPRRLCATVTLACYLLAALGLPLPAAGPRPAGDPSGACQGAACGCLVPEQCQSGCCCGTPARPRSQGEGTPPKPACCAGDADDSAPPACCGGGGQGAIEAPTPAESEPTDPDETPEPGEPQAPSGVQWRLGVSALKCQGQSTLWVTAGVVLPEARATLRKLSPDSVDWLHWVDEVAVAFTLLPVDPPPRSSHV